MKQIISIFAIAGSAFMASCSTTATTDQNAAILERDATIDALKLELAKQRIIDSMNNEFAATKEVQRSTAVASTRSSSRSSNRSRARRSSSSNYASYTGAGYSQPQPVYQAQPTVYQQQPVYQEPVRQKRGWSAKAKGAVIGAGTGAVSGAVINKRDRVKGAIIGGVLGAGVGTGIGAIIDRKNGR